MTGEKDILRKGRRKKRENISTHPIGTPAKYVHGYDSQDKLGYFSM
jgi:hypothetical protein